MTSSDESSSVSSASPSPRLRGSRSRSPRSPRRSGNAAMVADTQWIWVDNVGWCRLMDCRLWKPYRFRWDDSRWAWVPYKYYLVVEQ